MVLLKLVSLHLVRYTRKNYCLVLFTNDKTINFFFNKTWVRLSFIFINYKMKRD